MRTLLNLALAATLFGCGEITRQGKIAFVSNRDGNFEIYTINLDRSDLRRLTNNQSNDFAPRWSPDGNRIIFNSDRDGDFDIYLIDADGKVTKAFESDSAEWDPDWHPDGQSIIFGSNLDGDMELYLFDLQSEELRQLTNNNRDDYNPSISKDGKRVAYLSNEGRENPQNNEVYMIDIDGGNKRRLTTNNKRETILSWSPDGASLAFTLHPCEGWNCEENNDEVVIYNLEDSSMRSISNHPESDEHAYWSNDGSMIAFDSNRDGGQLQLYIFHRDRGSLTRISQDTSHMDFWSSIYVFD